MVVPLPVVPLAVIEATFKPRAGPERSAEIAQCVPGEQVILVPKDDNPYDRHAVAVYTGRERLIGYVRSDQARWVLAWLKADHDLVAVFQRATDFGASLLLSFDGSTPALAEG